MKTDTTINQKHKILCDAARDGDIETVRQLMSEPHFIDLLLLPNQLTPLHYAASNGNAEIIKLLLDFYEHNSCKESGCCDFPSLINNDDNPEKVTPLNWAALFGKEDAAVLLITRGADYTIQDALGKTALDYALENNFKEVAELLHSAEQE